MITSNLVRLIALSLALLVCLPAFAQSSLDENPANCYEVKDPGIKDTLDICSGHPGCGLVMRVHRVCTKVRSFLDRLNQTIGDGVRTLFGTRREVTPDIIFRAATPAASSTAVSANSGWQSAAGNLGEGVRAASNQTASGGSGDQAWSYQGDLRDGKPNGWGTQFNANGTIVRGQFRDGRPNGQADLISVSSETRHTGSFQDGSLNGRAYEYNRGETYVGSWRDNQREGYGTLTSADGSRFEGAFRANEINGPGTRYRSDGTVAERGIFTAGGQLSSGQRFDAQGRVTETLTGNTVYAQAEQANRVEQERLRAEAERKRAVELARQEAMAREQQEFRAKLESSNPGQLFAIADEFAAKGDAERAREVRRLLVSRFSDHPLAVVAAQQIASPPQSSSGAAGEAGGAQVSSAGGGNRDKATCDAARDRQENEFRQIVLRPTPPGDTPPKRRIMWITAEVIKLVRAQCPDTPFYQKIIRDHQAIYDQANKACAQMMADNVCPGPEKY